MSFSPSTDERGAIRRDLSDDVKYLKGVGPQGATLFAKLGISTVWDLLRHTPRRYEDRTKFRRIAELQPGEFATIRARVIEVENSQSRQRRMNITKVTMSDDTGTIHLTFFQQPYLSRQFQKWSALRTELIVYGLVKEGFNWGALEMERAEWEEANDNHDSLSSNRIVPVYPLTEGLTQKRMRVAVDCALKRYACLIQEILPSELLRQKRLMNPADAYCNIHFPESEEMRCAARERLVFEEFFLLQLSLARKRMDYANDHPGIRFNVSESKLMEDLKRIAPFDLTNAQLQAVREIAADVTGGSAMNRLLQGDVGSGKTIVALAAMLMAMENGYQSAIMAPTEILAQQHAIVFQRMLDSCGITVDLAIGSLSARLKQDVRNRIRGGVTNIAVGTHALIQEGIQFHKLGMVVIDEQHRFGVLQRQALHQKGESPHILVMTATPIPRTLTLTLYGDLDVSVISELPPGRKPIKTHWKRKIQAESVYKSASQFIERGRQVYVVCPLVEDSEKLQAQAATRLEEELKTTVFSRYRVGLLHGQMRTDEKDSIMRDFKDGLLDVLVTTTVIEVGIDVPNATVMIIVDADRFGLSQLHQLRGRVGRGPHPSYCILLADPKTDDGIARMKVMTETNDGFRIAEEDLKLRGPGEFFGTKQSGMPEFRFGNLLTDKEIMEQAKKLAFDLIHADPNLENPEHAGLKSEIRRKSQAFELMHVS